MGKCHSRQCSFILAMGQLKLKTKIKNISSLFLFCFFSLIENQSFSYIIYPVYSSTPPTTPCLLPSGSTPFLALIKKEQALAG